MTLDDLVALYKKKSWHPNIHIHPDEEAGIRAVVEALRPRLKLNFYAISQDVTDKSAAAFADGFIDEILGAAEDQAAGGPTSTDGPGGVEQAVPAVAPAADVCPYCNGEGCTPQLDRRGNVYPEPCQDCETTGKVLARDGGGSER